MPVPDLREVLVYLEQGQPDEAIPLLERMTRERPAHVTVHLLLARAYEQVGRLEAARVLWQVAQFLMPNSPAVRDGLRRIESASALAQDAEAPEDEQARAPASASDSSAGAAAPASVETPAAPDLPEAAPPDVATPAAEPEAEAPEANASAAPNARDEPAASPAAPTDRPMTTDDLLASLQQKQRPSAASSDDDSDDLQRLIDELEAARIEPSPDLDEIPAPELDSDIEDMVSETLARIYVAQGQHREAAKVYVQLARQHPERADEFEQRAEELRQQAAEDDE